MEKLISKIKFWWLRRSLPSYDDKDSEELIKAAEHSSHAAGQCRGPHFTLSSDRLTDLAPVASKYEALLSPILKQQYSQCLSGKCIRQDHKGWRYFMGVWGCNECVIPDRGCENPRCGNCKQKAVRYQSDVVCADPWAYGNATIAVKHDMDDPDDTRLKPMLAAGQVMVELLITIDSTTATPFECVMWSASVNADPALISVELWLLPASCAEITYKQASRSSDRQAFMTTAGSLVDHALLSKLKRDAGNNAVARGWQADTHLFGNEKHGTEHRLIPGVCSTFSKCRLYGVRLVWMEPSENCKWIVESVFWGPRDDGRQVDDVLNSFTASIGGHRLDLRTWESNGLHFGRY